MEKSCASCKFVKPVTEFHRRGKGFHSYCKECKKLKANKPQIKVRQHEWYLENKEITIERSRERAVKNPQIVKEYKTKHYANNAEKIKTRANKFYKDNKESPEFKLKRNTASINWKNKNKHIVLWRSLLRTALLKLKQAKINSTYEMLGYNAEELKVHLEKLWTPEMSWENYGKEWHVDHICQVHTFDPNTNVKIVNALNNLRPMWATTRTINGILYEGNLNRKRN
jgi:hypothetical protein